MAEAEATPTTPTTPTTPATLATHAALVAVFREEAGRLTSALLRILGDAEPRRAIPAGAPLAGMVIATFIRLPLPS